MLLNGFWITLVNFYKHYTNHFMFQGLLIIFLSHLYQFFLYQFILELNPIYFVFILRVVHHIVFEVLGL